MGSSHKRLEYINDVTSLSRQFCVGLQLSFNRRFQHMYLPDFGGNGGTFLDFNERLLAYVTLIMFVSLPSSNCF